MTIHFADSTSIDSGGSLGKIVQVVTNTSSTTHQQVNGTNTWTDVAPTCAITMTSSSNKVKIDVGAACTTEWAGGVGYRLLRGSTVIINMAGYTWNNTRWQITACPIIGIIDTPGSGTHTYKVQIRSSRNSNFYWNMNQASNLGNYSAQTCSMTLSEVAA